MKFNIYIFNFNSNKLWIFGPRFLIHLKSEERLPFQTMFLISVQYLDFSDDEEERRARQRARGHDVDEGEEDTEKKRRKRKPHSQNKTRSVQQSQPMIFFQNTKKEWNICMI